MIENTVMCVYTVSNVIYEYTYRGAHGVMIVIIGNGYLSPNLGEAVCISHTANTLWKGIDLTLFPPAMGK